MEHRRTKDEHGADAPVRRAAGWRLLEDLWAANHLAEDAAMALALEAQAAVRNRPSTTTD